MVSFLYIERKEKEKNNRNKIFSLSDSVSGKNGSRFSIKVAATIVELFDSVGTFHHGR